MEILQINICLDSSKHNVQTVDNDNKFTSKRFQTTSAMCIFKLIYDISMQLLSITKSDITQQQMEGRFWRPSVAFKIHGFLLWLFVPRVVTWTCI